MLLCRWWQFQRRNQIYRTCFCCSMCLTFLVVSIINVNPKTLTLLKTMLMYFADLMLIEVPEIARNMAIGNSICFCKRRPSFLVAFSHERGDWRLKGVDIFLGSKGDRILINCLFALSFLIRYQFPCFCLCFLCKLLMLSNGFLMLFYKIFFFFGIELVFTS